MYNWQVVKDKIKDIDNPIVAEVGVHRGVMSRQMLDHIPNLTLYMIDTWSPDTYTGLDIEAAANSKMKEYHDQWLDNYRSALLCAVKHWPRALPIRGRSLDIARALPDRFFDVVYIDAAHDADSVRADCKAWLSKVKIGGWLGGHDYGVFEGVKHAVDELFGDLVEIEDDFTWWVKI
jgi:DNA-binding ferritin-like protein (Dps family)